MVTPPPCSHTRRCPARAMVTVATSTHTPMHTHACMRARAQVPSTGLPAAYWDTPFRRLAAMSVAATVAGVVALVAFMLQM